MSEKVKGKEKEYDEAIEKIHQTLAEVGKHIGPLEGDEDGNFGKSIEGSLLTEWVIVMSWVDPRTGKPWITRCTSAGLPLHHEDGLLHQALYKFE